MLYNRLCSLKTSNGTSLSVSGVVILITLTQNNAQLLQNERSEFILNFENSKDDDVMPPWRTLLPTQVMTQDGEQFVSFPENNTANYPDNCTHLSIIAPNSGNPFHLNITYGCI